jgi:hypothetical protein
LFLIIVNVLGHPKGVGELTSYFLRGGGMDVFWNDPIILLVDFCTTYIINLLCLLQIYSTMIHSFLSGKLQYQATHIFEN